jgi:hypothetical protein
MGRELLAHYSNSESSCLSALGSAICHDARPADRSERFQIQSTRTWHNELIIVITHETMQLHKHSPSSSRPGKICNFHLSLSVEAFLCYSKWKVHSFPEIKSHCLHLPCIHQKCSHSLSSLHPQRCDLTQWSQEALLRLRANVFRHISLQIYHNHSFICLYVQKTMNRDVFMANTIVEDR